MVYTFLYGLVNRKKRKMNVDDLERQIAAAKKEFQFFGILQIFEVKRFDLSEGRRRKSDALKGKFAGGFISGFISLVNHTTINTNTCIDTGSYKYHKTIRVSGNSSANVMEDLMLQYEKHKINLKDHDYTVTIFERKGKDVFGEREAVYKQLEN